MKSRKVFIVHPHTSDQVNALTAFMKALKIKFEIRKEESYNPEFVEKLLESQKQARAGKVVRINKENLKPFVGKISKKYRGAFNNDDTKSFNEHTQEIRNEWDKV